LAQREKLFTKAAEHTMPYGLFVCDRMSGAYFEELMHTASSQTITDDHVAFSSRTKKKHSYKQQLLRFIQTDNNLYSREQSTTNYFAPTVEQVKTLAKKHF
jgi:hypothetical protein